MSATPPKIVPRNLTAQAARPVVGNPAITRPEDAVGNCYPGLEVDVRNLDRRFFPGLVFEFIARNDIDASYNDKVEYGARLAYVDLKRDPELRRDTPEAEALAKAIENIADGVWFLEWIEQNGHRLSMRGPREPGGPVLPLDGLFVWRLVRGLEPEPMTVTIELRQRSDPGAAVQLVGWRRRFTNPETGTISEAYQPGEMTQSLCSPWQHDFRDCACHYWAANRPDVVYPRPSEIDPATATGDHVALVRPRVLVDWIRRDRDLEATARETIPLNRPHQLDHYEMNRAWETLNVVLGDHEIREEYVPRVQARAKPYDTVEELADALATTLAPLEMTLALEYLYAMFSVRAEDEVDASARMLRDDVVFVRHHLKLIAMSEMQHLRWVNQLLWQLCRYELIGSYAPALGLIDRIPDGKGGHRDRQLRPLTPAALDDFIAVERPSGNTTGQYARVVATLKSDRFPEPLRQTAERIVNDGVDHATWFLDVKRVLAAYENNQQRYLRPIAPGTEHTKQALGMFKDVEEFLTAAYRDFANGRVDAGAHGVAKARGAMMALYAEGERLAKRGIGIPFWP